MEVGKYTIVDEINDEVRWAERFFSFSDIEIIRFRNCLEEFYLGKNVGKIRPRKASYLKAPLLRGCTDSNIVLLTAVARVYSARFKDYVELFLPDSLLEVVYPSDADKMNDAPDFADIADEISKNPKDKLQGELISEWCKYNKRVLLYISKASEVDIRQQDGVVTKFKIVSVYGTLLLNETLLEIINDIKSDEKDFLTPSRDGGIAISSPAELDQLKTDINRLIYFPNDDEDFSFGRSRNSRKQKFIEALHPLYKCLSERVKIQSSPIFDSFSNRDYYQFILDLLEIPIDFICVEDMELYLKSPKKIHAKLPDVELPF